MAEGTRDFVAGYLSGVAGLLVGSPLDVLKVRIQTKTAANNGTLLALKSIVDTEGLPALFKGLTAPIIGLAALNSLLFFSYGGIVRVLAPAQPVAFGEGYIQPIPHVLAAGFGAGVACSVASTPTELIKCQMQVQRGSLGTNPGTKLSNVSRVKWHIIKSGGLKGLYKGGWITICRDAPGYMTYFGVYESLVRLSTRILPPDPGESGTPAEMGWKDICTYLLAGGLAGCASWASIYPLDVIKSRIQTQEWAPQSSSRGVANAFMARGSAISMAREMYRTEGPGVFTHGLAPTMLRAFPVNAVTFAVFEAFKAAWDTSA